MVRIALNYLRYGLDNAIIRISLDDYRPIAMSAGLSQSCDRSQCKDLIAMHRIFSQRTLHVHNTDHLLKRILGSSTLSF